MVHHFRWALWRFSVSGWSWLKLLLFHCRYYCTKSPQKYLPLPYFQLSSILCSGILSQHTFFIKPNRYLFTHPFPNSTYIFPNKIILWLILLPCVIHCSGCFVPKNNLIHRLNGIVNQFVIFQINWGSWKINGWEVLAHCKLSNFQETGEILYSNS